MAMGWDQVGLTNVANLYRSNPNPTTLVKSVGSVSPNPTQKFQRSTLITRLGSVRAGRSKFNESGLEQVRFKLVQARNNPKEIQLLIRLEIPTHSQHKNKQAPPKP